MTEQPDLVETEPADVDYAGPERRRHPRVPTNQHAKIIIGDGFLSPDCLIVDLSLGGARVRVSRIIRLPPPVALLMVEEALLFDAAVAWRRGNEVGLVFKGHHDLLTDEDPSREAVRAVWAEFAIRSYED